MKTRPKPLVGITPSAVPYPADHGDFRRYASMVQYAAAVEAAGAIPVVLPFLEDGIPDLVGRLDGLVLSGGADIDPARFGDKVIHPDTYDIDPTRDAFEIGLVEEALAQNLPILAICRGIQVLNVALGGTLHQHLPDSLPGLSHRQHTDGIPADRPGHEVTVTPGTSLSRTVGVERLPVNSFHHQGIARLAADLVPIATSDDGLVEAVEHRFHTEVVGVQWHPELMAATDERQAALFSDLVHSSVMVSAAS